MKEIKKYILEDLLNKTNVFFTSDTHFSSERHLIVNRRPFEYTSDMDRTMIKNWNEKVKPDDIVFILGDVGSFNYCDKLNGKKILILGNYEREMEKEELEEISKKYDIKIIEEKIFIINIDNNLILMTHEPNNYNKFFEEIIEYNTNPNAIRLFVHIHKLQMIKNNALNVGVDCHNFYPLSLDDVIWYKNAIDNHYDKEVTCIL